VRHLDGRFEDGDGEGFALGVAAVAGHCSGVRGKAQRDANAPQPRA
jgi:hypothetical protein